MYKQLYSKRETFFFVAGYIAIWSLRAWRLGSWGLRVELRVQDLGAEGLGLRA